MSERQITLEVLRYRPESDSEPVFQSYSVPCQEEWVVLDALNYVKDHLDRTLSYRWSCHMAVCGSCAMVINDEPMLSCKAFLRDLPDHIRVEPLHNFPIERDLMISLDDFMAKLKSVKPYLVPKQPVTEPDGTYKQSSAQLNKFKSFAMCINCMACYSVCPQYALNEGFAGPAALALAHRYNADSRDEGRSVREDVVASNTGIWECTFVGACSEVCPKHVDPAAAIQQTKIASTVDYFKYLLLPGKGRVGKQGTGNGK
ncbi:succinate dehydrogenase/fumarate reductase iron-sulfur subunit [Magnetospira sp. QH-2]|uniref:succinate dehydrogenase/fumarate reductase iron-sulfur subunit n=1 Tax=Magnetospira sp. (strain QH-2) TaxID=1288970 RepID=UPI0003E817BB|nr:succinate dehydrogenase/fumarate reductase iron-sulfur subunit [Magnetospira sp. QH-2]CCQ75196.1 Fumarate reductase iron-sulfur subunit [Magnetospira sp. QH-2]